MSLPDLDCQTVRLSLAGDEAPLPGRSEHIATCDACQRFLSDLRARRSVFDALAPPLPPSDAEATLGALRRLGDEPLH